MNTVKLSGRLASYVDLIYTVNKLAIGKFKIEVMETRRDGVQIRTLIPCVCFDRLAERAARFKEFDQLQIDGKVRSREYTAKNGKLYYDTEIQAYEIQNMTTNDAAGIPTFTDEEIPF